MPRGHEIGDMWTFASEAGVRGWHSFRCVRSGLMPATASKCVRMTTEELFTLEQETLLQEDLQRVGLALSFNLWVVEEAPYSPLTSCSLCDRNELEAHLFGEHFEVFLAFPLHAGVALECLLFVVGSPTSDH